MSEKFYLLIQKDTLDVLGVFSRGASAAAPAPADVAGESLQIFEAETGDELARVPASVLEVKDTTFITDVVTSPLAYRWNDAGAPLVKPSGMINVAITVATGIAAVTFNPVAADTPLWIRIEEGGSEVVTQSHKLAAGATLFDTAQSPFQAGKQYGVICLIRGFQPFINFINT
jgi:hypothetical protein